MDKPTKEEITATMEMMRTPGWVIFEKWIENAKNTAISRCVDAPTDQRHFQGAASALCEITKFISELKNSAAKVDSGT